MEASLARRVAERFAALPPPQQRAFYAKLQQDGVSFAQFPIVPQAGAADGLHELSFAQARQWFLWRLDPHSSAYHLPSALHIRGALDATALEHSVAALVMRHAALRTVFVAAGHEHAQVRQRVLAHLAVPLMRLDLRGTSPDSVQAAAQGWCDAPFDLSAGPLMRVGVLHLAEDEYLLVVVMHHIICDGWSLQLALEELVAQYRAHVQGHRFQAPNLPIQYTDYAAWQRSWLAAGEQARQLDYWRAQLGAEHPVLQLAADWPRRAEGDYGAARHSFELPVQLVAVLEQYAAAHGGSMFMLLLAAWQVLLHRHTGQSDIRVGVPVANRQRLETEGLIGMFVNTQVLRNVLEPRMTLQAVLERARAATLGAQAHQDLPFEQLVEALQPQRSLSHTPLFQVMFNHQRADFSALQQVPGLCLEPQALAEPAAQVELRLSTVQQGERVLATLTYARELFAPSRIEYLGQHYCTLLRALVEQPGQRLGTVPLLAACERAQLLEWSQAGQAAHAPMHVQQCFEQQVERNGTAIALYCEGLRVSYTDLNQRANQLAHYLIRRGVAPEVRVGIALERSVAMVVSVLAVLKAGGAYIPLDPNYPPARLSYMLRDSGIGWLLSQRSLADALPELDGIATLCVEELDTRAESVLNPRVAVHVASLAYVIYTSGSTGWPKGCQITHANLARYLQCAQQQYLAGSTAGNFALYSSLSFDLTVTSLFLPLLQGRVLHIFPDSVGPDAALRSACAPGSGIDAIKLTPAHIALLARLGLSATDIEVAIVGGEALLPEQVRALHALNPRMRVYNEYGPTEATVGCVVQLVEPGCQSVTIGSPIEGCRVCVLDTEGELAPIGVPGELYIAGEGLARGYWQAAAVTAERFIADSWSQGDRLYRTGDRVRYRCNGQLEYLGRLDSQLKIRGLRIELGEIEAQLTAQPEVQAAAVVAHDDTSGVRLVAYVAQHAAAVDVATLHARLRSVLPDHMIPADIVLLAALPLTTHGKVDRQALPMPERAAVQYEAPCGPAEIVLAAVWSEVLGSERIGRLDSFFALGGHSLLALQMLELLRQRGWSAQVRALFKSPRLADFALTLGAVTVAATEVLPPLQLAPEHLRRIEASVPGGANNVQDIYPLAPLQEGILFQHLLQRAGDVYVTPLLLSFDSRARLEQFIGCLNEVIQRHDILRTAFVWEDVPEPLQVVYRHAPLQIQWPALMASNAVAEQLHALIDPARIRIDITRAPLVRAVAAQDGAGGRWLLQLPSHHLVLDHATLELLIEEVMLIGQGRRAQLPVPVPFARCVARARQSSAAEHTAFFDRMLGDVSEPTAPFGLLQWQESAAVTETTLAVPASVATALRRAAQRQGVSAATLFHLAWALVLGRVANRDDVVFGTVVFGRMLGGADITRAFGLFINTLPLRVRLRGHSVASCIEQVQRALADLMQHEHASLALALRSSAVPPGAPLFSALFNYRHGADRAPVLDGIEVFPAEERTHYPVTLSVTERREGFELVAQVTEGGCGQLLCEALLTTLQSLTEALAAGGSCKLTMLEVLPAANRQRLLARGVRQRCDPGVELLHRWFEQRAREQPEAIALRCGEVTLSYRQLNRRANRLAHHLHTLGVRPDGKVGILLERSVDLVCAVLGILKAGAAYVPLDPHSPAARLGYIVRDSGIGLLISERAVGATLPADVVVPTLQIGAMASDTPDHDPQLDLHAEQLAYVIYTSGSTGRPKGVQITHRNVTRLLAATRQWFDFGPADVWTLFHSCAFDFSVWEMFGALCTGGELVVVPYWVSRSPEEFLALLQRHAVTVLNQTPAAFRALLELAPSDLKLRYVIFGGEALEPASLAPWVERYGDAEPQLINMYGITETTVHVTWRRITRADVLRQCHSPVARSPVGRSIPDLGLHILDANLDLLPEGVAGDLYVSGAGLARGYLDRAGLTAERFIADPFDVHGGRLYRTGDVARWCDGELEYFGRSDQQVKIRGFRIELGEIEAQLLAQAPIRAALVAARDGELVAYLTGEVIDVAATQRALSRVLPDYMVPSAFVVLEALPLTVNGKIDRAALPDPQRSGHVVHEAPLGAAEEAAASVWAEVLGLERIGRNDQFFALGGHSLLAIRILQRLRVRGWRAEVRALFERPRLQDFAHTLLPAADTTRTTPLLQLSAEHAASVAAQISGGADNIQEILPLGPLQQGILFHHRLHQDVDVYLTRNRLAFDNRERLADFIGLLDRALARHDVLRVAVLWEQLAEPVQVVQRCASLQLEVLEFPASEVAAALAAHVRSPEFRIDVTRAPLMRAVAAHDPVHGRWLLELVCHHLVLDHTTLELLVEEMALLRDGNAHLLPPVLPLRTALAEALQGPTVEEQQEFFTQQLGEVTEPTAPYDIWDVQGDGRGIRELRVPLAAALAEGVRRSARTRGVAAATLCHVAWAMVLAKTTGKRDVVFGTVLFGRMHSAERALGMFINTLPLRVRLQREAASVCVQRTHAALAALLHHEHASLALAQRCSGLTGGAPLFATLLNYRYGKPADRHVEWPGMTLLHDEERTNYPITLSIDDRGDDGGASFELVWQTAAGIDAQRLHDYFVAALQALVNTESDQPLCEVELLSVAEQRELHAYGVNDTVYAGLPPLPVLFEQQVRRTPQAIALEFDAVQLSYAQLNERCNRLAHRLREHGIGAEMRVGLCLERSVDMLVALLAVLKAGAAYVPLDPQLPDARLHYMIEDSAVALLLTHAHLQARLPSQPCWVLDELSLQHQPAHDLPCTVHAENLAYVIYTSGSTGRPKGVMLRHRALSHFLRSMQQAPGLTASDVLVAVTSVSFDIAALELYLPLLSGARVVLGNAEQVREGRALAQLLERSGATLLQSTPAGWRMLRAAGWPQSKLTGFKALCGGEALPPDLAQELTGLGMELWNLYGPTETTIWSAAVRIEESVAVGGAIADTQLQVLDGELQAVPQGVAGELYLGGVGLARGYLEKPGLTAQRFIAHPWRAGERLYRTGDLVRWRSDGRLDYLGRIDQQVKVRGYRIELGEIEAQLLSQPWVGAAVVVAQGEQLVGYVSGDGLEGEALREQLSRSLPAYMVPAVIVVLGQLPLTGSGKVDRRALVAPALLERGYEAPQGELEQALAQLWSQVLGVERIGRHDNFFALGGHSLKAMALTALVQQRLGIDLPLRALFELPTVAELSAAHAAAATAQLQQRSAQWAALDALLSEVE